MSNPRRAQGHEELPNPSMVNGRVEKPKHSQNVVSNTPSCSTSAPLSGLMQEGYMDLLTQPGQQSGECSLVQTSSSNHPTHHNSPHNTNTAYSITNNVNDVSNMGAQIRTVPAVPQNDVIPSIPVPSTINRPSKSNLKTQRSIKKSARICFADVNECAMYAKGRETDYIFESPVCAMKEPAPIEKAKFPSLSISFIQDAFDKSDDRPSTSGHQYVPRKEGASSYDDYSSTRDDDYDRPSRQKRESWSLSDYYSSDHDSPIKQRSRNYLPDEDVLQDRNSSAPTNRSGSYDIREKHPMLYDPIQPTSQNDQLARERFVSARSENVAATGQQCQYPTLDSSGGSGSVIQHDQQNNPPPTWQQQMATSASSNLSMAYQLLQPTPVSLHGANTDISQQATGLSSFTTLQVVEQHSYNQRSAANVNANIGPSTVSQPSVVPSNLLITSTQQPNTPVGVPPIMSNILPSSDNAGPSTVIQPSIIQSSISSNEGPNTKQQRDRVGSSKVQQPAKVSASKNRSKKDKNLQPNILNTERRKRKTKAPRWQSNFIIEDDIEGISATNEGPGVSLEKTRPSTGQVSGEEVTNSKPSIVQSSISSNEGPNTKQQRDRVGSSKVQQPAKVSASKNRSKKDKNLQPNILNTERRKRKTKAPRWQSNFIIDDDIEGISATNEGPGVSLEKTRPSTGQVSGEEVINTQIGMDGALISLSMQTKAETDIHQDVRPRETITPKRKRGRPRKPKVSGIAASVDQNNLQIKEELETIQRSENVLDHHNVESGPGSSVGTLFSMGIQTKEKSEIQQYKDTSVRNSNQTNQLKRVRSRGPKISRLQVKKRRVSLQQNKEVPIETDETSTLVSVGMNNKEERGSLQQSENVPDHSTVEETDVNAGHGPVESRHENGRPKTSKIRKRKRGRPRKPTVSELQIKEESVNIQQNNEVHIAPTDDTGTLVPVSMQTKEECGSLLQGVNVPDHGTVEETGVSVDHTTVEETGVSVDHSAMEETGVSVDHTTVEETGVSVDHGAVEETGVSVDHGAMEETSVNVDHSVVEETGVNVDHSVVEETGVSVDHRAVEETGVSVDHGAIEETGVSVDHGAIEETGVSVDHTTVEETGVSVDHGAMEETSVSVDHGAMEETSVSVDHTTVEETGVNVDHSVVEETSVSVDHTTVEETGVNVDHRAMEETGVSVDHRTVDSGPSDDTSVSVTMQTKVKPKNSQQHEDVRPKNTKTKKRKRGQPRIPKISGLQIKKELGIQQNKEAPIATSYSSNHLYQLVTLVRSVDLQTKEEYGSLQQSENVPDHGRVEEADVNAGHGPVESRHENVRPKTSKIRKRKRGRPRKPTVSGLQIKEESVNIQQNNEVHIAPTDDTGTLVPVSMQTKEECGSLQQSVNVSDDGAMESGPVSGEQNPTPTQELAPPVSIGMLAKLAPPSKLTQKISHVYITSSISDSIDTQPIRLKRVQEYKDTPQFNSEKQNIEERRESIQQNKEVSVLPTDSTSSLLPASVQTKQEQESIDDPSGKSKTRKPNKVRPRKPKVSGTAGSVGKLSIQIKEEPVNEEHGNLTAVKTLPIPIIQGFLSNGFNNRGVEEAARPTAQEGMGETAEDQGISTMSLVAGDGLTTSDEDTDIDQDTGETEVREEVALTEHANHPEPDTSDRGDIIDASVREAAFEMTIGDIDDSVASEHESATTFGDQSLDDVSVNDQTLNDGSLDDRVLNNLSSPPVTSAEEQSAKDASVPEAAFEMTIGDIDDSVASEHESATTFGDQSLDDVSVNDQTLNDGSLYDRVLNNLSSPLVTSAEEQSAKELVQKKFRSTYLSKLKKKFYTDSNTRRWKDQSERRKRLRKLLSNLKAFLYRKRLSELKDARLPGVAGRLAMNKERNFACLQAKISQDFDEFVVTEMDKRNGYVFPSRYRLPELPPDSLAVGPKLELRKEMKSLGCARFRHIYSKHKSEIMTEESKDLPKILKEREKSGRDLVGTSGVVLIRPLNPDSSSSSSKNDDLATNDRVIKVIACGLSWDDLRNKFSPFICQLHEEILGTDNWGRYRCGRMGKLKFEALRIKAAEVLTMNILGHLGIRSELPITLVLASSKEAAVTPRPAIWRVAPRVSDCFAILKTDVEVTSVNFIPVFTKWTRWLGTKTLPDSERETFEAWRTKLQKENRQRLLYLVCSKEWGKFRKAEECLHNSMLLNKRRIPSSSSSQAKAVMRRARLKSAFNQSRNRIAPVNLRHFKIAEQGDETRPVDVEETADDWVADYTVYDQWKCWDKEEVQGKTLNSVMPPKEPQVLLTPTARKPHLTVNIPQPPLSGRAQPDRIRIPLLLNKPTNGKVIYPGIQAVPLVTRVRPIPATYKVRPGVPTTPVTPAPAADDGCKKKPLKKFLKRKGKLLIENLARANVGKVDNVAQQPAPHAPPLKPGDKNREKPANISFTVLPYTRGSVLKKYEFPTQRLATPVDSGDPIEEVEEEPDDAKERIIKHLSRPIPPPPPKVFVCDGERFVAIPEPLEKWPHSEWKYQKNTLEEKGLSDETPVLEDTESNLYRGLKDFIPLDITNVPIERKIWRLLNVAKPKPIHLYQVEALNKARKYVVQELKQFQALPEYLRLRCDTEGGVKRIINRIRRDLNMDIREFIENDPVICSTYGDPNRRNRAMPRIVSFWKKVLTECKREVPMTLKLLVRIGNRKHRYDVLDLLYLAILAINESGLYCSYNEFLRRIAIDRRALLTKRYRQALKEFKSTGSDRASAESATREDPATTTAKSTILPFVTEPNLNAMEFEEEEEEEPEHWETDSDDDFTTFLQPELVQGKERKLWKWTPRMEWEEEEENMIKDDSENNSQMAPEKTSRKRTTKENRKTKEVDDSARAQSTISKGGKLPRKATNIQYDSECSSTAEESESEETMPTARRRSNRIRKTTQYVHSEKDLELSEEEDCDVDDADYVQETHQRHNDSLDSEMEAMNDILNLMDAEDELLPFEPGWGSHLERLNPLPELALADTELEIISSQGHTAPHDDS